MTTKKSPESERNAELAPFYVVGALSPAEKALFEAAMARDPELAKNVAAAREERDEVLALNDAMPAPSPRALQQLLAGIEAEPARKPSFWSRLDLGAALAQIFSPRALGWTAVAAGLLVTAEAGLLTLQRPQPVGQFTTASQKQAPMEGGSFALVIFAPDANVAAISKLLARADAKIVDGPRAGGFYRVRLGGADLPPAEAQRRLDALRQAKALVRFAEPTR